MDLAIQRYDMYRHMEMLRYLFLQRKLDPQMIYEAPKVGYLVLDHNNYPVAAGFLRKCEGNFAFIDGFITDPNQPPDTRNSALDLLTKRLVKAARGRKIIAFTVDECIITRAKKHGFAHMPHVLMVYRAS